MVRLPQIFALYVCLEGGEERFVERYLSPFELVKGPIGSAAGYSVVDVSDGYGMSAFVVEDGLEGGYDLCSAGVTYNAFKTGVNEGVLTTTPPMSKSSAFGGFVILGGC